MIERAEDGIIDDDFVIMPPSKQDHVMPQKKTISKIRSQTVPFKMQIEQGRVKKDDNEYNRYKLQRESEEVNFILFVILISFCQLLSLVNVTDH